jgi:hypothetical protein
VSCAGGEHPAQTQAGSRQLIGSERLDRGDGVRAFCDTLEIQRPIVVDVSPGGFVAQGHMRTSR